MITNIRNIIFLIFFLIFFYEDLRKHSVKNMIFIIYFIIGLLIFSINIYYQYLNRNVIEISNILECLLSIFLGAIIYIVSILSKESIGKGDAFYFIINSFYISFVENISLFIIGIFVSTLISIFIYIKNRGRVKNIIIPFIPCLLPMIVWRIICMQ